jgi:hypothetical protein
VLAYNIKKGNYGQTPLNGLNVLGLGYFKGNYGLGQQILVSLSSLMSELGDWKTIPKTNYVIHYLLSSD